ncbi:uncharacterized protein CANTADRAFT_24277 [Suhomyces tanzawaensis NRRL Y-17324]|uniref:Uncharacterized protein n=1 Tax=Suhomyces tanzawaensis NRRL Y-17324 TaxID=984487 RepID=A0A1E4SB23_9ASCO|nr:uncharacterized protein CANTADRAFT_24277 [Suhomyces tanzawaensis NRRL Y-17324]ODV76703.1 hypothetical protein CANTADRAFT_24277 [Suhomyces tanzawaensis NRRL Y-17324]
MSVPRPLTDLEKLAILDHHTYHSTVNFSHTVSRTLHTFSPEIPNLSEASIDFINKINEEGIRKRTRHEIAARTLADYNLWLLIGTQGHKEDMAKRIYSRFNSMFEVDVEPNLLARYERITRGFNLAFTGEPITLKAELDKIVSLSKEYSPNCIYFFNEVNLKQQENIFTFSLAGNLSNSDFLDPLVITNLPNEKFNYYPTGLLNSYQFENYLRRINMQLKLNNRHIVLICRNNVFLDPKLFSNIKIHFINLKHDKHYSRRNYLKLPDEYGLSHWLKFNLTDKLFQLSNFTEPSLIVSSLCLSYHQCITKLLNIPIYHKFVQLNINRSEFLGPFNKNSRLDKEYMVVSDIYVVKNEKYDRIPTNYYNNIFKSVDYNYASKDIYYILQELRNFGSMSFTCETTMEEISQFIDKKLMPFIASNRKSSLSYFNAFFSELMDKEKGKELPPYKEPTRRLFSIPLDHWVSFKVILDIDNAMRDERQMNLSNDGYVEDNLFPKDDSIVIKNSGTSYSGKTNEISSLENGESARVQPPAEKESLAQATKTIAQINLVDNVSSNNTKPLNNVPVVITDNLAVVEKAPPTNLRINLPAVTKAPPINLPPINLPEVTKAPPIDLPSINLPSIAKTLPINVPVHPPIQEAASDTNIPDPSPIEHRPIKDRSSISPNKFFNKVPSPPIASTLPKIGTVIPTTSYSKISALPLPLPSISPAVAHPRTRIIAKQERSSPVKKRKTTVPPIPTVKKSKILEVLQKDKLSFVGAGDGPIFSDDSEDSDNSFDPTRNERIKIRNENNRPMVPSGLSNTIIFSDRSNTSIQSRSNSKKSLVENSDTGTNPNPEESGAGGSDVNATLNRPEYALDSDIAEDIARISSSSSESDAESDADYESADEGSVYHSPGEGARIESLLSDLDSSGHDISKPIVVVESIPTRKEKVASTNNSITLRGLDTNSSQPRRVSLISEVTQISDNSDTDSEDDNGPERRNHLAPVIGTTVEIIPDTESIVITKDSNLHDIVMASSSDQDSEMMDSVDELDERFPVSQKRMMINTPTKQVSTITETHENGEDVPSSANQANRSHTVTAGSQSSESASEASSDLGSDSHSSASETAPKPATRTVEEDHDMASKRSNIAPNSVPSKFATQRVELWSELGLDSDTIKSENTPKSAPQAPMPIRNSKTVLGVLSKGSTQTHTVELWSELATDSDSSKSEKSLKSGTQVSRPISNSDTVLPKSNSSESLLGKTYNADNQTHALSSRESLHSPTNNSKSHGQNPSESPHRLVSLKDIRKPVTTKEDIPKPEIRRPGMVKKNAFKGRNEFSSSESESSSDDLSSEEDEPPKASQPTIVPVKKNVLFKLHVPKIVSPKKYKNGGQLGLPKRTLKKK